MYDKLASKVSNIDTSESVLKSKYQTEKAKIEKKTFLVYLILLEKQNPLNQKKQFQMLATKTA